MVVYAALLHVSWAACLMINSTSANATAMSAVYRFVGGVGSTAFVLVASSAFSILGLFLRCRGRWMLLVPQQIILMMSATGAVAAIWLGHYADGVARPASFIAVDQMYAVLTAIGYTVALIYHARSERDA